MRSSFFVVYYFVLGFVSIISCFINMATIFSRGTKSRLQYVDWTDYNIPHSFIDTSSDELLTLIILKIYSSSKISFLGRTRSSIVFVRDVKFRIFGSPKKHVRFPQKQVYFLTRRVNFRAKLSAQEIISNRENISDGIRAGHTRRALLPVLMIPSFIKNK